MSPGLRVLAAPDSFKGTFTAVEVAAAVARGCAGVATVDRCPVADGGEGTAAALIGARGGELREAPATDPRGRPIQAGWAMLGDGLTAVVEVAAASGLGLVEPALRDPLRADSRGTGTLIAAAIEAGAREVLVAAGGSATTDGGIGALAALRDAGGSRGARITVLTDVTTPFERAAAAFGPQKGADPAAVATLAQRLRWLAEAAPRDPRGVPGSGAAGGLAGGLWAHLDARIVPGAPYVLDAVGFGTRLARCDAVVTGEGRIDAGSLRGKLTGEVIGRAVAAGTPCCVLVGEDALEGGAPGAEIRQAGTIESIEAASRGWARALLSR